MSRISKIPILSDLKRKTVLEGLILQLQYQFLVFLTKSVWNIKELLNFQTPDPQAKV